MLPFDPPLVRGTLIRRYKRFLADVQLQSGETVTAHCANTGPMTGCAEPGWTVWLSPNRAKTAKLAWRWELVEAGGALVGINTARPNRIVEAAIGAGLVPELTGYGAIRREVRYGANSRIDLMLQDHPERPGACYVEVKNVTLKQGAAALFPDTVTTRGLKHLKDLSEQKAQGDRAVMFYLVHRDDCTAFAPAWAIDPAYAEGVSAAAAAGVECLAYACRVTPHGVALSRALPIRLGRP